MKKISSILMLSIILISCQVYAGAKTKPIDIQDFTKEFFDKCGVNTDDGRIFYPSDATVEDNKYYLTYEDNNCYDLKIMIDNIKSNNDKLDSNNKILIVKQYDSNNTYTILSNKSKVAGIQLPTDYKIDSNTNLIIPKGITLTKNNAKLIFDCDDSKSISNIFIFGTLQGNHGNSSADAMSIIDIGTGKTNSGYVYVIIGPNGRYVRNTNKAPIYAFCNNVNFLLYPECELRTENSSNIFGNDMIAGEGGNLYLNRFTKVNKLLSGQAEESINVIYPNIPA